MAFSEKNDKRIAKVVRRVERMPRNPPAKRRRGRGGVGLQVRWGKLDDDLEPESSQTVSLWWEAATESWGGWDADSTKDVTAYAPPWLESGGTISSPVYPSGAWVLVMKINGRWVVLLCFVAQDTVTDSQVDETTGKFEIKTRAVLVTPTGDESGWTVIHTGDLECA